MTASAGGTGLFRTFGEALFAADLLAIRLREAHNRGIAGHNKNRRPVAESFKTPAFQRERARVMATKYHPLISPLKLLPLSFAIGLAVDVLLITAPTYSFAEVRDHRPCCKYPTSTTGCQVCGHAGRGQTTCASRRCDRSWASREASAATYTQTAH